MSADAVQPRIAVFGGRVASESLLDAAYQVGRHIADREGILYCGGMGGIMEAASRGAADHGGIVVGILPTATADSANPYVTIPIVTGIGTARNSIIARSVHGAIAINGRYGTLSEIAYSLDLHIPVVGIQSWEVEGVIPAADARDAIAKLWEACQWE